MSCLDPVTEEDPILDAVTPSDVAAEIAQLQGLLGLLPYFPFRRSRDETTFDDDPALQPPPAQRRRLGSVVGSSTLPFAPPPTSTPPPTLFPSLSNLPDFGENLLVPPPFLHLPPLPPPVLPLPDSPDQPRPPESYWRANRDPLDGPLNESLSLNTPVELSAFSLLVERFDPDWVPIYIVDQDSFTSHEVSRSRRSKYLHVWPHPYAFVNDPQSGVRSRILDESSTHTSILSLNVFQFPDSRRIPFSIRSWIRNPVSLFVPTTHNQSPPEPNGTEAIIVKIHSVRPRYEVVGDNDDTRGHAVLVLVGRLDPVAGFLPFRPERVQVIGALKISDEEIEASIHGNQLRMNFDVLGAEWSNNVRVHDRQYPLVFMCVILVDVHCRVRWTRGIWNEKETDVILRFSAHGLIVRNPKKGVQYETLPMRQIEMVRIPPIAIDVAGFFQRRREEKQEKERLRRRRNRDRQRRRIEKARIEAEAAEEEDREEEEEEEFRKRRRKTKGLSGGGDDDDSTTGSSDSDLGSEEDDSSEDGAAAAGIVDSEEEDQEPELDHSTQSSDPTDSESESIVSDIRLFVAVSREEIQSLTSLEDYWDRRVIETVKSFASLVHQLKNHPRIGLYVEGKKQQQFQVVDEEERTMSLSYVSHFYLDDEPLFSMWSVAGTEEKLFCSFSSQFHSLLDSESFDDDKETVFGVLAAMLAPVLFETDYALPAIATGGEEPVEEGEEREGEESKDTPGFEVNEVVESVDRATSMDPKGAVMQETPREAVEHSSRQNLILEPVSDGAAATPEDDGSDRHNRTTRTRRRERRKRKRGRKKRNRRGCLEEGMFDPDALEPVVVTVATPDRSTTRTVSFDPELPPASLQLTKSYSSDYDGPKRSEPEVSDPTVSFAGIELDRENTEDEIDAMLSDVQDFNSGSRHVSIGDLSPTVGLRVEPPVRLDSGRGQRQAKTGKSERSDRIRDVPTDSSPSPERFVGHAPSTRGLQGPRSPVCRRSFPMMRISVVLLYAVLLIAVLIYDFFTSVQTLTGDTAASLELNYLLYGSISDLAGGLVYVLVNSAIGILSLLCPEYSNPRRREGPRFSCCKFILWILFVFFVLLCSLGQFFAVMVPAVMGQNSEETKTVIVVVTVVMRVMKLFLVLILAIALESLDRLFDFWQRMTRIGEEEERERAAERELLLGES